MPRQRSGSAAPKSSSGSARYGSSHSAARNAPQRGGNTPFTRTSRSNLPAVQPKAEAKPVPAPAPAASSGRSTSDVMKDMAATAAGVAVGSAVGHAVGAGITGAFSGGGSSHPVAPAPERRAQSELVEEGPCAYEIRQFLKCSEENTDLTVCQTLNEAMKQCRQRYNL